MKNLQTKLRMKKTYKAFGLAVLFFMLFTTNSAIGQTSCGYTYTTTYDSLVCNDDTANYSVSTSSGGTKYYSWSILWGQGKFTTSTGSSSAGIDWSSSSGSVRVYIYDSTNSCMDSVIFNTSLDTSLQYLSIMRSNAGNSYATNNKACHGSTENYYSNISGSGYTVSWSVQGGTYTTATNGGIDVTWGSGSSGSVTLTVSNGVCTETKVLNVSLVDHLSGLLKNRSICKGQPIYDSLLRKPNYVYNWSTGDTTNYFSDTPTTEGWISVYAYDTTGKYCDVRDSMYVSFYNFDFPVYGRRFSCTDTAYYETRYPGGVTYRWDVTGGIIQENDSLTYIGSNANWVHVKWSAGASSRQLKLTVTGLGCTYTDSFAVELSPVNRILDSLKNVSFCKAQKVTISVPFDSNIVYTWYLNADTASLTNTFSDSIYSKSFLDLVVTDTTNGCTMVKSVSIDITNFNVPIYGRRISCWDTAHYVTTADLGVYKWKVIGGKIEENDSNVYEHKDANLIHVTWDQNAAYRQLMLIVSNGTGCTKGDSFDVHLTYPDTILSDLADTLICSGGVINFSVPYDSNYNYIWMRGLDTISTSNSITDSVSQSTGYTILISNAAGGGCSASKQVKVIVNGVGSVSINGPQVLCGDSAMYSANLSSTNYTYYWSVVGGTIAESSSGSHSGLGADKIHILWSASAQNKGVELIIDNGSCTASDFISVTTSSPYLIPAWLNDTSICSGQTVNITLPMGSGYNFAWWNGVDTMSQALSTTNTLSISPTQTTTYTVRVTDTSGGVCASLKSFTVYVDSLGVGISGLSTVCRGGASNFMVNYIDSSLTYTWYLSAGGEFSNGNDTMQGMGTWISYISWNSGTTYDTVTLMLVISGGSLCQDTFYKDIVLLPKPVASFIYLQECGSKTVRFTSTSSGVQFPNYNWIVNGQDSFSSSTFDSYTFQHYTNNVVTLKVWNSSGCIDMFTDTLELDSTPIVSVYKVDTICKGDSIQLPSIQGAIYYYWSSIRDSIVSSPFYISPPTSTIYRVMIQRSSGCYYSDSYYVYVDTTCVWPGDADASKLVDQDDALYIGLAYGETGASRANASSNWYGQYVADWDSVFSNGTNYKHADCDGNGTVDLDDLIPMGANFGYSHSKYNKQGRPGDPNVFVTFSKDSVTGGDAVKAIIHLGSDTQTVSDVYGIAFVLEYNINPFKSVSTDLSNSWLGSSNNLLSFLHHDTAQRRIHIAISRTNQMNVSGKGEVGTLNIVLPDNIAGKRSTDDTVIVTPRKVTLIDAYENRFDVFTIPGAVAVYGNETGIMPIGGSSKTVSIYPNPVSQQLNIAAEETIKEVRVYNLIGAEIVRQSPQTRMTTVSMSEFAAGAYNIVVRTENGVESFKVIKK